MKIRMNSIMGWKLRRRILTLLIGTAVMACAGPAQRLDKSLLAYERAIRTADYDAYASMTYPSVVEMAGGPNKFAGYASFAALRMEQVGMVPGMIEFEQPGKLVKHNGVYISIIPSRMPLTVKGKSGVLTSSVIAFSKDNGVNWFFMEATPQAIDTLETDYPGLASKITIPAPTMTLGSGDSQERSIKRKGTWTKE